MAQLGRVNELPRVSCRLDYLPKVDQTTLSKEDNVTATGHGVAVNLRLDVDDLDRVLLQPSDVNFNVEVTDAIKNVR